MGKGKLEKFAELNTFPNVYQNFDRSQSNIVNNKGEIVDFKGQWCQKHFKNDQPLVLELACGKGDYALGLAAMFPTQNYIGVDVKGNRIWNGAKRALENHLPNVAFVRNEINYIADVFDKDEVSEIWITFPDPFLRKAKAKKRLTHPRFLEKYFKILQPNGLINLKTDSPELFEFTLETIEEEGHELVSVNHNIYAEGMPEGPLSIRTYYEHMHIADGRTIRHIQFKLNPTVFKASQ